MGEEAREREREREEARRAELPVKLAQAGGQHALEQAHAGAPLPTRATVEGDRLRVLSHLAAATRTSVPARLARHEC